jgi:hypothetical protein
MTQPMHQNASPRESPTRASITAQVKDPTPEPETIRSPSAEPVDPIEEEDEEVEPVEPSKMPMSPSIEYLDDDDYEEEDDDEDKFNYDQIPPSMGMRPPPTSISTIRLSQQNRVK